MATRRIHSVTFTANQTVELIEAKLDLSPLEPDEISGKTIATLISPGTELNDGFFGKSFPRTMGYSAIFEVEDTGQQVTDIKRGDLVFSLGRHTSYQRAKRQMVVPVPKCLSPQTATFARLMAVSMTTLTTTRARPGAEVLITGLGPIGHFAAKIFSLCQYRVSAVDPVESRRRLLNDGPYENIWSSVPVEEESTQQRFSLAIDCSGHEKAIEDACRVVRKGSEVVLIGAHWRGHTEISAHQILHAVFFNNVTLRGGTEWGIPLHPIPTAQASNFSSFATALQWLAEDKVDVNGLYDIVDPSQAQPLYEDLLHKRRDKLTAIFDWSPYQ